jgi:hypothetical protein
MKKKRTACRILGALALLAMILLVGGTEMGWMPFGKGVALAAFCEAAGAALLWKGGVIRV